MISTGHLRYARSAVFSSRRKSRARFDHLAALLVAPDSANHWPLQLMMWRLPAPEEIDEEDDASEADDEADDNIEVDPDIPVTAD